MLYVMIQVITVLILFLGPFLTMLTEAEIADIRDDFVTVKEKVPFRSHMPSS